MIPIKAVLATVKLDFVIYVRGLKDFLIAIGDKSLSMVITMRVIANELIRH